MEQVIVLAYGRRACNHHIIAYARSWTDLHIRTYAGISANFNSAIKLRSRINDRCRVDFNLGRHNGYSIAFNMHIISASATTTSSTKA